MYLSQKKFRAAATRIFAGALTLTASLTAYGGKIVYQNGFESTAKFMEFTQVNDIPSYEDHTLEWEYSRATQSAFINLYESDYWAFLTTPALQLKADCTYSFSLTATLTPVTAIKLYGVTSAPTTHFRQYERNVSWSKTSRKAPTRSLSKGS